MLYTNRFIRFDLNNLTHSVGETAPDLMDAGLKPLEVSGKLLQADHEENSNRESILILNMPFDHDNNFRGWIAIRNYSPNGQGLFPFPGRFAKALHRARLDYIFISGTSPEPVYIYLSDMLVLFEDPEAISGLKPALAAEKLVEKHPWVEPEVMIPAEDASLHFISDKYSLPGLGALFNRKNLKAIVVDGSEE